VFIVGRHFTRKTKKAHERFNREIFGQKVARATDEREAINHDIVVNWTYQS
jgi:hypothetical protein